MIRFQRILGISLLAAAMCVAFLAMFRVSLTAGIAYLLISLVCLAVINYSFCAKCTCREHNCAMIFPGKLSKLWPARKANKYTRSDVVAIVTSLMVMTIIPQYWLWSQKLLLVLFWVIFSVAHVQIRMFVCRDCKNANCGLLPQKLAS